MVYRWVILLFGILAYATSQFAVLSGGMLVTVAYSLLGRAVGCPLAGKLSDILIKRGISRAALAVLWLVFAVVLLRLMSTELSTLSFSIVAFFLGMSINLFALVSASVSETYGPERTASILSFVNTMAQVSGATALGLSGYMGISLNSQAGNSLAEYRGIWLFAMACVAVLTALGATIHFRLNRLRTTTQRPIETV